MEETETNDTKDEERRQIVAENLKKLAEMRERGSVSREDFPPEGIFYLNQELRPLVRNDLRKQGDQVDQAIVISQQELEQIGFISFISPEGTVIDVFAEETGYEPEEVLVIFPDELGEVGLPTMQLVKTLARIIKGEYGSSFPDEDSVSPAEVFFGPILDLNDEALSKVERTFLEAWIEEHLGNKPEEAPVKTKLISSDEATRVVVFNVVLGQENDLWYLSRWQNKGERPSFVFWPEEMYDDLIQKSGYYKLVEV